MELSCFFNLLLPLYSSRTNYKSYVKILCCNLKIKVSWCLLHRNEGQNDVELFCVENLISLSSKSIRTKTFFPTCFNETSWANYIHMGYNYKFLNLVFFYVGKQKELFNEPTMTMFMISCVLQTYSAIWFNILMKLQGVCIILSQKDDCFKTVLETFSCTKIVGKYFS